MFDEFKEFAMKGNVLDALVGGFPQTGVVDSLMRRTLFHTLGIGQPPKRGGGIYDKETCR
jgi:large-conductance mechanosensitive channel